MMKDQYLMEIGKFCGMLLSTEGIDEKSRRLTEEILHTSLGELNDELKKNLLREKGLQISK